MGAFRQVNLITIKRKYIDLTRQDRYGHWWFEIRESTDPASESYGWWPKAPLGLQATFAGIEGELNGQTNFGGSPNRDPHHGDSTDQEFHPYVASSDSRSDEEIADCLREFSGLYRGEWRWSLGKGQNCHSFQKQAMVYCKLRESAGKSAL